MDDFKPYFIFSTSSLIIAVVLSWCFDFSLTNTWQASVALVFVLGPYWLYAWKAADFYDYRAPFLCQCAKYALLVLAAMFVIVPIVFLFQ